MKDLYAEPFLNSWPKPFSLKELFGSSKKGKNKEKSRLVRKEGETFGIFKSFYLLLVKSD